MRSAAPRIRLALSPLEPRLLLSGSVADPLSAGGPVFLSVAQSFYVDDDAPSDPGHGDLSVSDPLEDGTAGHPFDSIQEAIDASLTGATITVLPGTYYESGISYGGKALTVTGTDPTDAGVVEDTVVAGGAQGSVFVFSGEGADSVLSGLTVTNGQARFGAGIYVLDASPTITHCRITGNLATYPDYANGGGLYFVLSDSIVSDCVISNNGATGDGGGIFAYASELTVTRTVISRNAARQHRRRLISNQ